jgi:hypothetical protein
LALAPILSCKLFSCLVVYGKIDTAAPIARRVVQAFAVAALLHTTDPKKPTKEFAIDPTTSLPLLSWLRSTGRFSQIWLKYKYQSTIFKK